jgi:hypothetical protein
LEFDSARSFSEGLAVVEKDDQFFYLKTNGERLSPETFEEASDFEHGAARVRQNGRWRSIDQTGKLSPPEGK